VALKTTVTEEWRIHAQLDPQQIRVFDDRTTEQTVEHPAVVWIVGLESVSSSDRVTLALNKLITERTFVAVDESTGIKGHRARRTERLTLMAERARYRLIMTGTPLTQGVEDLFAQMRFLSPAILGYRSWYSFAANHLEYSKQFRGKIVRAHNTGLLAAKIAPYAYQIGKECLDLPPKLHKPWRFDLTLEQRRAYHEAKHTLFLDLAYEDVSSYQIYLLFNALQQIVCGFWRHPVRGLEQYQHDRLDMLLLAVGRIPADEKIIVWAKYLHCIDEIVETLEPLGGVARWDGRMTERERDVQLARFRGEARVFVATPATGGYGLTLNEAHHVVFYTNSFKYAERIQAEDRCHRYGQRQAVTYHDLVARGSIDERIEAALRRKENVLESFRDKVEAIKHDTRADIRRKFRQLVEAL
jgi:SNF2 family DNA or RNA helicase